MKNDLMKPRYKVIANYPDNKDFAVGDIIEFEKWQSSDLYWANIKEDCQGRRERLEGWFTEYPHLFKKLQWYEERSPEDIPQYLKHTRSDEVFKVVSIDFRYMAVYLHDDTFPRSFMNFLPSTEYEYLSYLKTKTP